MFIAKFTSCNGLKYHKIRYKSRGSNSRLFKQNLAFSPYQHSSRPFAIKLRRQNVDLSKILFWTWIKTPYISFLRQAMFAPWRSQSSLRITWVSDYWQIIHSQGKKWKPGEDIALKITFRKVKTWNAYWWLSTIRQTTYNECTCFEEDITSLNFHGSDISPHYNYIISIYLLYGYNSTRALIGCWPGIMKNFLSSMALLSCK